MIARALESPAQRAKSETNSKHEIQMTETLSLSR